jgi:type I restriction enzyme, S subunit
MIEGLKPYPEYKESGLPWLGRCPDHWKVRRTKILFQERVQKGFPNEPLLAATQTKGVVRKEDYETRTVTAQKDLHLLKLVEVGDYVISLRSFQGGIEVAYYRGIISPAYTVLKPRGEAKSGYYSKFFKSRQFIDSLSLFVTGIREGQNIDYERMSRAEMPCPPPDEQAAIVRFLDHANRKIDGFIRAKRKLIALLNEQKQAIIHGAVTRGLNPNAKLKPSGIPWLGEIPEHWEVLPIMRVFSVVYRYPTYYDISYITSGIPEVRGEALVNGKIVELSDQRFISKETNARFPRTQLKKGDLVMSVRGTMGKIGVVGEKHVGANITANLLRLSTRQDQAYPEYLSWLMRSAAFLSELDRLSPQTTIKTITMPQLASIRLCRPPLVEQQAIVEAIEDSTHGINTAIARTEREIALMQEYRTRLTADIVTGKLDVREAAAKLPEVEGLASSDSDIAGDETEPEDIEA